MMNNVISVSTVVSIRQSEKGNTYLRIWNPDIGVILISDRKSFDLVCKAVGGWVAQNLVYVTKKGPDGDWQDLQFRGVLDLELKVRQSADGANFGMVISASKQKSFTVAVPKGVATVESAEEAEEVKEVKAPAAKTAKPRKGTVAPF